MPYIDRDMRPSVVSADAMVGINPQTSGELAYALTVIIMKYLNSSDMKFKDYNEVMGVLECVKHELYRRVISEYEQHKLSENGDVYHSDRVK